jgi:hypothetical protein
MGEEAIALLALQEKISHEEKRLGFRYHGSLPNEKPSKMPIRKVN